MLKPKSKADFIYNDFLRCSFLVSSPYKSAPSGFLRNPSSVGAKMDISLKLSRVSQTSLRQLSEAEPYEHVAAVQQQLPGAGVLKLLLFFADVDK